MRSKVILFCALFLCSQFVESIPFGNEELSRQREYQSRNWQGNQNTAEQHHGSGFAQTQNIDSLKDSAQQFENNQEYNSHQGKPHYENQATLLQALAPKESQVNFARNDERKLDNLPTRKNIYPELENHSIKGNNQFLAHNWGNRFANSAPNENEKPLVTVHEPYRSPGQQNLPLRPPVHEQSQQQLNHQHKTGGLYPVSRDLHYNPKVHKSDNVGYVEHSESNFGPRTGGVRYENAHSSNIANSGNNAFIQNPRPYAEPVRSQHFETFNEPAKHEPFKHGSYSGHPVPINNGYRYNDGRAIPMNTGFKNEHARYIENPILSGHNNRAQNGYQAPIPTNNKRLNNIGNNKYLENPLIHSGFDHPAPLHTHRNDKIPVIHSIPVKQVPIIHNFPAAPVEPKNNRYLHNGPDDQVSNSYVPEAPIGETIILNGPENERYEPNSDFNSEQEDDNTYKEPETVDESDSNRHVENPVIIPESNYPALMNTNEPQEPIKNEAANQPLIRDYKKDSSLPIDKFVDNLYKSGETYNINPDDREKLREHLSKSKKSFVLIDTETGSVEYINALNARDPPDYVVMKKDDKLDGNIAPSQPTNPISEELEPPIRHNKNDYIPPNNGYKPSPQFPSDDNYNPLPVKHPSNNDNNNYKPSYPSPPQFPVDNDYNKLPVTETPNDSDCDESRKQKPQFDNDKNSPSEPIIHNNNHYKPSVGPHITNGNNYNPTYDTQYPPVNNHHYYPNEHIKPLRSPVHGHQNYPFNPSWDNKSPGSPSKLHTHVNLPTSTTPAPLVDDEQPHKFHGHENHPFNPSWDSNTPGSPPKLPTVEDREQPHKLYTPTSTTQAPAINEKEPQKIHTHIRIPVSSTPAPEIDEEELKKYLDSLPNNEHVYKPSSTPSKSAHQYNQNDNSNNNDKSQSHKPSKAHPSSTTPTTTTTTESDEFIEEFLESLSQKSDDTDVPFADDNDNTTPKSSDCDKNKQHITTSHPEDEDQIITLSPIEQATDNVRDESTSRPTDAEKSHNLHHDTLERNVSKSKPTTKINHQLKSSNQNQSDDNISTKNKNHDCSEEDTDKLTENPSKSNPTKLHRTQHSRNDKKSDEKALNPIDEDKNASKLNRNQNDDKVTKKNKKHDYDHDDTVDEINKDKTACNDSLINTEVPAKPDDNSAAETNSENGEDVTTSNHSITGDYLLESSTDELKITVSIPNDSDGTVIINIEVPDSTGDEGTPDEDLVVTTQSKQTTDKSQGWDQNKTMVLDLSNAVVLMNKTMDRDDLSQLMPNNSSLTVFIIEMPHQDKVLVESYKETKIYPNGTCVEECKTTTWKNEHDKVPTVVTKKTIYSCDRLDD